MKQIFDWLREQFDKQSINGISENGLVVTSFIHSKIAKLCIDEAEAKWESDCCEWEALGDYHKSWNFCPYCGKSIRFRR